MLVHDWSGCHRDDGFRSRWAVAQSTICSFGVVVFPPLFDQDLCFAKRVEDLTIQQLIPEPCVEAFAISVLPGRPRLDVGGLGADGCNPVSDGLSNELGAVI